MANLLIVEKSFKNFNKIILLLSVLFALLIATLELYSSELPGLGLYEAAIEMDNKTLANSDEMLKKGLLQVLEKISGRAAQDIQKLPTVEQALEKPEIYLLKYNIQIERPVETGQASDKISVRYSHQFYSSTRVDNLIKAAGLLSADAGPNNSNSFNNTNNLSNYTETMSMSMSMSMKVRGVNSLSAYSGLNRYLENLAFVKNIQLTKMKDDILYLSINIKTGRADLLNRLNQDNKLILENPTVININNSTQSSMEPLQFRWASEL